MAKYTNREGKAIEIVQVEIPEVFLLNLYQMQDQYSLHEDEHYTIEGVLRKLLQLGIDTQDARWKWATINKGVKKIDDGFKKTTSEILSASEKDMSAEDKLALIAQEFKNANEARESLRRSAKKTSRI